MRKLAASPFYFVARVSNPFFVRANRRHGLKTRATGETA
jgi:hypothetical protein